MSSTNVAIIVASAVVGTAILSTVVSCFVLRYRRKKSRDREGLASAINISNEKMSYEKPIAVRGTPPDPTPRSPRFTPFGGGTGYPMDKFKLPDMTLSPFLRKKTNEDGQSEIGFAKSEYNAPGPGTKASPSNSDVYGVSPTSFRLQKEENTAESNFRLQKDTSVKSATSVRLIRVGSTKGKEDPKALLSPTAPPPPRVPVPIQTQAATAQAVPVTVVAPSQPGPRSQSPELVLPADASPPLASPAPVAIATRSMRASEPEPEPESPAPTPNPPRDPNPNPYPNIPVARNRSGTMTSQQRLRFRDSSDVESAEPSPAIFARSATTTSMRNTNTASLRTTSPNSGSDSSSSSSPPPLRRPKNAGPASFATFPRLRNGPPRGSAAEAIMNRNRGGLGGVAARLREEAERRKRETGDMSAAPEKAEEKQQKEEAAPSAQAPNWPFGSS